MNTKNTRHVQYLSAVIATFSVACASMHSSWTSPVIPKIAAGLSPIDSSTSQEAISWMVSSCTLGGIPGIVISGWSMEKFGRQRTLQAAGILLFIPWMLLVFATSIWTMCIARFIAGIGMSAVFNITPIYNGEIAEKDVRGKLGSTVNVLAISGDLVIYIVGPFVSYLVLCLCCSVFPLLFVGLFYFMPESPYYLVKVANNEAAAKSLRRLTRERDDVVLKRHLDEINQDIHEENKNRVSAWEFLSKKQYRKYLVLILGIKTLFKLSGITVLMSYMQSIIDASQSNISSEVSSVIIGVIQLAMALAVAFIVDRMGRKPLLITSCLGCAVALIGEGIYFYMQDVLKTNIQYVSWLPSTSLILFFIMRPLGVGTVTPVIIGELFPSNLKGHIVILGGMYTSVLSFSVLKSYETVSSGFGRYIYFWVFALVNVLGALFIGFMIPETKGKTLSEIQVNLKHKSTYKK